MSDFEQKIKEKKEAPIPIIEKRGRHKKEVKIELPPAVANEGLANFFQMMCNQFLNVKKYPKLKITDEEALKWSIPHNQLMEFYLGHYGAITFIWINAAMQWTTLIALRLKIMSEFKKDDGKEDNIDSGSKRLRKNNSGSRTDKK